MVKKKKRFLWPDLYHQNHIKLVTYQKVYMYKFLEHVNRLDIKHEFCNENSNKLKKWAAYPEIQTPSFPNLKQSYLESKALKLHYELPPSPNKALMTLEDIQPKSTILK